MKKIILSLSALTISAAMFAQSNESDVDQNGDLNSAVVTPGRNE